MLSLAASFLLLSLSSATPSLAVIAANDPTRASSAKQEPDARGHGGAILIFTNGFETGTHAWGFSTTYSKFETSPFPNFSVDTCNLPPGDYIVRLDADNGTGGHSYEYSLTVTEVPCDADPLAMCLDLEFGAPTITFR